VTERTLRAASAVLAAAGAAIAGYLLYVREAGGQLVCATGGCETVQGSPYAEVLGLPVAALALVGFVGLLIAALARGEWAGLGNATLALAAFLFSGYLLYIQLAVVEAICQWCLATDVITTAIAALALLRLRLQSSPAQPANAPARPHPQRRPNGRRSTKRKTKQRARSR
jgi:uncharacterized membrane protein